MMSQQIIVLSATEFRSWLRKNHNKEKRVAVVLYKRHTGKSAPTHRELIEEAICYGWIDTTIKRLDDNRYIRNFSRRNEQSTWSDNTLSYAKQLIKEGRMKPAGLKFYTLGRKKPTHDATIPKNPRMPEMLNVALEKNLKAKKNFSNFPPSAKKMFYRWLLSAKREDTQKKRVAVIVAKARQNSKTVL